MDDPHGFADCARGRSSSLSCTSWPRTGDSRSAADPVGAARAEALPRRACVGQPDTVVGRVSATTSPSRRRGHRTGERKPASPRQRAVIALHHFQDRTVLDTVGALRGSVQAVPSHAARARTALRTAAGPTDPFAEGAF